MAGLGACAMSLWGNAARLTAVNSRVEPRGNMGVESEVLRATTAFRPAELTAVNFVFGGGALRKLAIAASVPGRSKNLYPLDPVRRQWRPEVVDE